MEVIDNFGNVYSSVREFCRKKQCARAHVVEQLKKMSEYYNFKKGIAIKPVIDGEETTLPTLPPPPPPKKKNPSTPPAPPAEVDEEYEAFKAVRGTDFKFYNIEAPADKDMVRPNLERAIGEFKRGSVDCIGLRPHLFGLIDKVMKHWHNGARVEFQDRYKAMKVTFPDYPNQEAYIMPYDLKDVE